MLSRHRESLRQGALLFASTIVGSLALYAFRFAASRGLGVEAYGTLASLLAAVTLVISAATLGTTIVGRFAAQFYAQGEEGRLRRLLDLMTLFNGTLALAGIVLIVVLNETFARFLHVSDRLTGAFAMALMIAGIIIAIVRGAEQGMHRFAAYSVSSLVESVGKAVGGLTGVFAGLGVRGVLGLQLLASVGALAYTYFDVRSSSRVRPVPLGIELQAFVGAALGITIVSVAMSMLIHIDVILAKHYLTDYDAGLYSMAALPAWALATVMGFLPALVLPKATALGVSGESGRGLLMASLGTSAVFCTLVLALFYVAPALIVRLLGGAAFLGAASLVFPFGVAASLYGLTNIVATYSIGRGRYQIAWPLLVCALTEILVIVLRHGNATEILQALIALNLAAFIMALTVARFTRSARA